MMKVTLAKALVVKNRLVNDITTLKEKIKRANAVTYHTKTLENIPEPRFNYDIRELLNEFALLQEKFIVTKTAISLANKDPQQQSRIFGLSELKNFLSAIKEIPCADGENYGGGRYGDGEMYTITRVQIKEQEKEDLVKQTQQQIDAIQEAMEKFNWGTEIEIPD